MDYRSYRELMERYGKLNKVSIDREETEESLIRKLMDISCEKKQIWGETNAIIREYITKYEEDPGLLDGEACAMLEDFFELLMRGGSLDLLDPSVSLRISRLLLGYYQTTQDLEQIIRMLRFCSLFDLLLIDHTDDYASTPYSLMAEQYLKDFDELSDEGKRALSRCFITCAYNRKDPAFALKKYREVRESFEGIYQKAGGDLGIRYNYFTFKSLALDNAVIACQREEDARNAGTAPEGTYIDLEKDGPLMEEFARQLKEALLLENAHDIVSDRVTARLHVLQTEYHLGKLTIEELLAAIEECARPHEDYDGHEQFSALLTTSVTYLTYLCRCNSFDRQYVLDKSMEIIDHVLNSADDAVRELREQTQYFGTNEFNECALKMISAVSNFVDFDFFKRIVLDATVYADKALYVHTMMVKEICLAILDYILDRDPGYLDGVAGRGWEYWRDHREELLTLMENCALFHDIGKYFCLDIVSNSSRSLTDDEFEVIKHHPLNFSTIYRGDMTPEIACIRDCALLHHMWYNEAGGYPREKHTANKPLVNILTVADCMDAATDNIGRPYGMGKTLGDLVAEFDESRDVRYSGYISGLLHEEEIQRKIDYVINDRRREIYCDIYLRA